MRSTLLCFCIGFFLIQNLSAQCNSSNLSGVHTVQKGETLFSLARQYNLSVQDLCTWNNRDLNAPLLVCDELVVSSSLVNPMPTNYSVEFSSKGGKKIVVTHRQEGNWHTVRWGETVESIAEAYGYTEKRFREFNKMDENERLNVGTVIKSTDCFCDTKNTNNITVAAPASTAATASLEDFAAKGGGLVEVQKQRTAPKPSANTKVSRSFIKTKESSMIDEINLMRSNPAGYVQYVREYVRDQKSSWNRDVDTKVVNSLIKDLESAGRLSQLVPNQCLYDVAQVHGDYLVKTNGFGHNNGEGKGPWRRMKDACSDLQGSETESRAGFGSLIGNENLVVGRNTVRKSVIALLLDEGMTIPGHRETLLAPDWKYVACAYFEKLSDVPNGWIQMFGK